MKIYKLVTIIGCCGLFLAGCTQSHYVHPDQETLEPGPDFNIYENYELDEDQLLYDVLDVGLDQDTYPMAAGIDFGLRMDEGIINVAAVVKDGTPIEDAIWYGTEALKVVNDQVASQDFSYEMSSADSYGGIYKDNDAHLDVYYSSAFENGEAPILSFEIPAGAYLVPDPNDTDSN